MHSNSKNQLFFFCLTFLFFSIPLFSFASETIGTIGSTTNSAWSNSIGWINFAPTDGGLTITDSTITGSVWSKNYGWINFAPTNGGVTNDGEGNLSGTAWGNNVGWISFSGVTINANGQFTGEATGSIIGTLTFNCTYCDVQTDWRPESVRELSQQTPPMSSSGGSGGSAFSASPVLGTSTTQTNSASTAPEEEIENNSISSVPVESGLPSPDVQSGTVSQGTTTPETFPSDTASSSVLAESSGVQILHPITTGGFFLFMSDLFSWLSGNMQIISIVSILFYILCIGIIFYFIFRRLTR